MPNELDEEALATSSSTLTDDAVPPAVDAATESDVSNEAATAGGGEGADPQSGDQATPPNKQPAPSEKPKGSLASVLDHLSEKDGGKTQKKTPPTGAQPQKPAADAKEAAGKTAVAKAPAAKDPKTEAKPSDDALTPDDLRAPERTRKRIESLLTDRKADREQLAKVREEYEQAKPIIEQGKAFADVVKSFGLEKDVAGLEDEDVAGAVRFQASVVRLIGGKGTKADLAAVTKAYEQLDQTREALGLAATTSAQPTVDVEAFRKALENARENLEFGDLRKLIDALPAGAAKAADKQAPPVRQPIRLVEDQPQTRERPQAQQPAVSADDRLYEVRAIERMSADGVADPSTHFEKQVFPRILADLKTIYAGQNPVQVFQSLSAQAKHDATIRAHEAIQKQSAKLKPETPKPAPQHRAMSTSGQTPSWAKGSGTASTAGAAINHLARD